MPAIGLFPLSTGHRYDNLAANLCLRMPGWPVLYSFFTAVDGYDPQNSGVILDPEGNLYGTTEFGGQHSGGVVFELMRP